MQAIDGALQRESQVVTSYGSCCPAKCTELPRTRHTPESVTCAWAVTTKCSSEEHHDLALAERPSGVRALGFRVSGLGFRV